MTAQPMRRYTILAGAILIAAALVSASLLVALGGTSTVTNTTTETATSTTTILSTSTSTTRTCTLNGPDVIFCITPLRVTEAFDLPSGTWNLTASINSSSVQQGHSVRLSATLTNQGSNETIPEFVEPLFNPAVFAMNGTLVWQLNPPQSTSSNVLFPSGQTISQTMNIPTSKLEAGQTYSLVVVPLNITVASPGNVTLTAFQFCVTSTSNANCGSVSSTTMSAIGTSIVTVQGSATTSFSGNTSPTQGGAETLTVTVTTTTGYPGGTTTVTHCSSTGTVTVTQMEITTSQATATVTTTATYTATSYGYTSTDTSCAATTTTTTVTQA